MASKKQQERKKKAREQKAQARVMARRYKQDQLKKEDRKATKLNRKFREKLVPIVKDPEKKKKLEELEAKKNLEKLENNMKILKALEEEYLKERDQKRELNENLESQGHNTLQEKLNALESAARTSMTPSEAEKGVIDLVSESIENQDS